MPPKEEVLRLRIDSALKRDAEAMANSQGETLSVIIRQILRREVQDWKGKALETDPQYQAFLRQQEAAAENQRQAMLYASRANQTALLNDAPGTKPGEGNATAE